MSYARDKRIADDVSAQNPTAPCMICQAPTAWDTLSMLGARCSRCFRAYCAQASPSGAFIGKARAIEKLRALTFSTPGGTDWARRLQEREQNGEKLTRFQREAWRKAIVHAERADYDDSEAAA